MTTPLHPTPTSRLRWWRRWGPVVAAGLALAPLAACSQGEPAASSGATTATTTAQEAGPGSGEPPEQYSGPDDAFYEVPDPLPGPRPPFQACLPVFMLMHTGKPLLWPCPQ